MLSQPPETFQRAFGGRTPTPIELLQAIEAAIQPMAMMQLFQNDLYCVKVRAVPPFIHLNIHRHDGQACKEWRHFQQIKNELVGPEFEAIELFPAESRLVDTSNEYHLWVHADAHFRFPVGFENRWVLDKPLAAPAAASHDAAQAA